MSSVDNPGPTILFDECIIEILDMM